MTNYSAFSVDTAGPWTRVSTLSIDTRLIARTLWVAYALGTAIWR